MIELGVWILGLWTVSGVILLIYRISSRIHPSAHHILFGSVATLAVWGPPVLQNPGVKLAANTAGPILISAKVLSPVLLTAVLLSAMIDGRRTTARLMVTITAVLTFVGLLLPILVVVGGLIRSLLGIEQTLAVAPTAVRSQIALAAALLGGLYALLFLYGEFGRWLSGRGRLIAAGLALLVSGWLEGLLSAVGTTGLGTDWGRYVVAEVGGSTLAMLALAPVGLIALSLTGRRWMSRSLDPPRGFLPLMSDLFDLRRALQESESQVAGLYARLQLLTSIRHQIVRAESEQELLQRVCRRLVDSRRVQACWVGLTVEGSIGVERVAAFGMPKVGASHPAVGDGPRRGAKLTDLDIEADPAHQAWLQRYEGSWLAFPLLVEDELLGTLVVYGRERPFDDTDEDLLRGVADDLAYGLSRLRLQSQRALRVRELDAIRASMAELLRQHTVAQALDVAANRALKLLNARSTKLYFRQAAEAALLPVAQAGEPVLSDELSAQAARAAESGAPWSGLVQTAQSAGIPCLAVPFGWREQTLGVIVVIGHGSTPFPERQLEALELFTNQVAIALENARLIEAERRGSQELEVLRKASLSLTSNLELKPVLEAILDQALGLLSAYDAHIFLYDGRQLSFGAALWEGGQQREPYKQPRQEGLTYSVARSGERIVVEHTSTHPFFADTGWDWDGSIIGLPLKVGGRVLGVMNLAFEQPRQFAESELHILELLADQAAVVLENARLFEQTASERRNLRLLYDIARELSASLDPDEILQRAVQLTTDNLGGLLGAVNVIDWEKRTLHIAGLAGVPIAQLDEIDAAVDMKVGKGFVGWVAEHNLPAVSADIREDPRWVHVPGVDDEISSAMAAPIRVDGKAFAVMAVFHRRAGVFSQAQLDLLVAICQQVGLAHSNARRYRQVERQLAERTALQQVARTISSRLEMQPLLDAIVEQVSEVLGYTVVDITLVEGDELVMAARHGPTDLGEIRLGVDQGVIGGVVRSGKPVIVPDVTREPNYIGFDEAVTSEIAVPLTKGGVVIGALNVEAYQPDRLTEDDLRLLVLVADQVSIAIENAALYDRLQQHSEVLEEMVAARTEELREALLRAQEGERIKTQFVTDVSHELRTPLSNIQLYVELLQQSGVERRAEYLKTLGRETERLASLIEDLLSISRLDSGKTELSRAALDLNQLSESLVSDRARLFAERGLELIWEPCPGAAEVQADSQLLGQVIGNLLTNAMHYTPEGGRVWVRTRLEPDGGWVSLSIEDTGLGIADGEQDHLFSRFFRGAASRQMGNPGTGLGLAICREIAERHGGRIEVESTAGEGSVFTLWLPVQQQAEAV